MQGSHAEYMLAYADATMLLSDGLSYEALDYVAKAKVKAITETYSLNDISRVYERVANGQVRFRAVITDL